METEVNGECPCILIDIVVLQGSLSAECLCSSGLNDSETTPPRAYEDGFTIALVTARRVGIVASLLRLSQRAVQVEC